MDAGFFITDPTSNEPELHMYRLDTSTVNTNGIANIKFGNSTHDTNFDGSNPNVVIQAFGGRSSTTHTTTTSPVTFRFQTTTYSTSSTSCDTRWEMRSVNQDDAGANRGLHAGSFGNVQVIAQVQRGGSATTIPTCGSRFIYAYAEDGGPISTGTTNIIDIRDTSMSDLRTGQTFEIFAEINNAALGSVASTIQVQANWVGAGTTTKTIAQGTGGAFFGYMRCVYIDGQNMGGQQNGWYGFFGADHTSSGAVSITS